MTRLHACGIERNWLILLTILSAGTRQARRAWLRLPGTWASAETARAARVVQGLQQILHWSY